MVIELLKFKIAADVRDTFIQKDEEIWTAALANYPGFLAKEVWLNPDDYTEITFIVRWATREQWKAISPAELQDIEKTFAAAVGATYELVAVAEYQQLPANC
ncbi:TIGR03792 family protein [Tolypothrix sp. FACHB-123]|uniref:TIGR03792 family protein n=1 Tax=Tolypothrix sp. FACHB-123 TaxID=2692868 RepID=UPI001682EE3B|nr:TIGR03792 family protein [Tolypothrix sp. FACHB-123]MBD2356586.1 TIGR03792 family protein [Tolypothrix sp. FACHB-123]